MERWAEHGRFRQDEMRSPPNQVETRTPSPLCLTLEPYVTSEGIVDSPRQSTELDCRREVIERVEGDSSTPKIDAPFSHSGIKSTGEQIGSASSEYHNNSLGVKRSGIYLVCAARGSSIFPRPVSLGG